MIFTSDAVLLFFIAQALKIFPTFPERYTLAAWLIVLSLRWLAARDLLQTTSHAQHTIFHYFSQTYLSKKTTPRGHNQDLARSIPLIVEASADLYRLLYLTLTGLAGLFIYRDLAGGAGVLAYLSLSLFIPLSLGLSRTARPFFDQAYAATKRRWDAAAQWIEWSEYIRSYRLIQLWEKKIRQILQTEMAWRNREGFYRSWDIYLMIFGKAVPIITILIVQSRHMTTASPALLLFILWLSGLFIPLFMEWGRTRQRYYAGKTAWQDLLAAYHCPPGSDAAIVCTPHDTVWDGTLADNIGYDPAFHKIVRHLQFFRDWGPTALQRMISYDGKDISQGQKARIVLARALIAADRTRQPLQIDLPLTCLDAQTLSGLDHLIRQARRHYPIFLSPTAQENLQRKEAKPLLDSGPGEDPALRTHAVSANSALPLTRGLWHSYRQMHPTKILGLFLLPAAA
ncbi:MAG: hypothetical protein OWS74_08070, partial [Firmicutes bacterium]|nr:hypothetical protein [Bacillota bacterium]